MAFFWLLHLNHTVMVAMITGAAAFAAGTNLIGSKRSLRKLSHDNNRCA